MTPEASALASQNRKAVYAIAYRLRVRLGGDVDDLIGDGMEGLCQAATRFDPSRFAVPFSTYARTRITGAIIDGDRKRNYVGDHGRSGRRPDDPLDEDVQYPGPLSTEDHALDRLALGALLERVAELPEELQAPVRVVMGGGTFKALAESVGVTESRISQRLGEARRRLRAA